MRNNESRWGSECHPHNDWDISECQVLLIDKWQLISKPHMKIFTAIEPWKSYIKKNQKSNLIKELDSIIIIERSCMT